MYRVLHISDLHFGKTENRLGLPKWWYKPLRHKLVNWSEAFSFYATHHANATSALYDWLKVEQHNIHLVVISGDIATTGEWSDQQTAASWVNEIVELDHKVCLIPGNHDRITGFPPIARASLESFNHHFRSYWPASARAEILTRLGPRCSEAIPTQVDYVFIGVDFGRQHYMIDRRLLRWKDSTRVQLGGGEVTDIALQQLEKLTVTEQQAYPSAKIVWVVHYLPWVKREEDLPHYLTQVPDWDELENSNALLSSAAQHNISLIMCGHVHTHGDFIANKTTPVAVAASTGQWRSRLGPRMHLMDFPGAGKVAPTTIVDFEFRDGSWQSSNAWRSISV